MGSHRLLSIGVLLGTVFLVACAGNGNGLDANGNPAATGSIAEPLTADFKSIQDNIFTPICTKCHIGAGAPQGLQLDADHSYALLVGVASSEQPNVLRVEAGDPDSSYIIRKLMGASGISGQQMPLGGPYLPQSTIDVIRQWISAGAQSAAAQSIQAAVRAVQHLEVAVTSPDDAAVVLDPVRQIVVRFNADLDYTQVNDAAVSVTNNGVPVPVRVRAPRGDSTALLIEPPEPLSGGTYQVTLHSWIANLDAQGLGSDKTFSFTVDELP